MKRLFIFFGLILLFTFFVEAQQNSAGCSGGLNDGSVTLCTGTTSFTRTTNYQSGPNIIVVRSTGPTITVTSQNVCPMAQQRLEHDANCRATNPKSTPCACNAVFNPGFKIKKSGNCCEIWGASISCQSGGTCS